MTFPQSHIQGAVSRSSLKVYMAAELMASIEELLEGKGGGMGGPIAGKPYVMSNRKCHTQKWLRGQAGSNLVSPLKDEENGVKEGKGLDLPRATEPSNGQDRDWDIGITQVGSPWSECRGARKTFNI